VEAMDASGHQPKRGAKGGGTPPRHGGVLATPSHPGLVVSAAIIKCFSNVDKLVANSMVNCCFHENSRYFTWLSILGDFNHR